MDVRTLRVQAMATIDHVILKSNDLATSVVFYRDVLGFAYEGIDGQFTVLRIEPDCQLQLAPHLLEIRTHD